MSEALDEATLLTCPRDDPNHFGSQTRLSVEVADVYYEGNFVRDGGLPIWEEAGQAELKALVAGIRADRLSANGTLKAR